MYVQQQLNFSQTLLFRYCGKHSPFLFVIINSKQTSRYIFSSRSTVNIISWPADNPLSSSVIKISSKASWSLPLLYLCHSSFKPCRSFASRTQITEPSQRYFTRTPDGRTTDANKQTRVWGSLMYLFSIKAVPATQAPLVASSRAIRR